MKKFLASVASVAAISSSAYAGCGTCEGEEHGNDQLSFSADLGFSNKYIWRGQNLSDEPVMQGSLNLEYETEDNGVVGLNIWANMEVTGNDDTPAGNAYDGGDVTEIDFTAYWEQGFEEWTLGAGLIHYNFPSANDAETSEIYVSLTHDSFFNPSVTVFYDFDEADGFYVDLGASHEYDVDRLIEGATVELAGHIGFGGSDYNDFYHSKLDGGVTDGSLSATLNVPVTEDIGVAASVAYVTLLGNAEDQVSDGDNFVFGVNAAFSF